jgi:hypothetical protein
MQLPEDFPHDRREQYLVVLPEDLQTLAELDCGIAVLRRLQRFYDSQLVRHVVDRLPAEASEEDIALALASVFAPVRRHALARGTADPPPDRLNRGGTGSV